MIHGELAIIDLPPKPPSVDDIARLTAMRLTRMLMRLPESHIDHVPYGRRAGDNPTHYTAEIHRFIHKHTPGSARHE